MSAAVRNNSFFSACIEDERLLGGLQELVNKGLDEGWSVGAFVDEALIMLDAIAADPSVEQDETFRDNFERLYDVERLRLIFTTQRDLSLGYKNFCRAFEPATLWAYPAWEFKRQPGAIEQYKRRDHVKHEGVARLKTDIKFWLARNHPSIGGFGNPYGPWGFNSWMREVQVSRKVAEEIGLLKPGEEPPIPPELAEWGLPQALKKQGQAGVTDLTREQKQNVVDRCEEKDIKVTEPEPNKLQVEPNPDNPQDPLTELDEQSVDAWLDAEAKKLGLEGLDADDWLEKEARKMGIDFEADPDAWLAEEMKKMNLE